MIIHTVLNHPSSNKTKICFDKERISLFTYLKKFKIFNLNWDHIEDLILICESKDLRKVLNIIDSYTILYYNI